jgi:hypothetical protein
MYYYSLQIKMGFKTKKKLLCFRAYCTAEQPKKQNKKISKAIPVTGRGSL